MHERDRTKMNPLKITFMTKGSEFTWLFFAVFGNIMKKVKQPQEKNLLHKHTFDSYLFYGYGKIGCC